MYEFATGDETLSINVVVEKASSDTLRTRGLSSLGYSDLIARLPHPQFEASLRELLRLYGEYQLQSKVVIKADEKLVFGYWIVMTKIRDDALLELWESTSDGNGFLPGVELTLRYWVDQHATCTRAQAAFTPPNPAQMVAISEGVIEGDYPLSGIRYDAPPHMSGWYLTTERYNGDIETMRVEHMYHVTAVRPELARYIALPPGYRFNMWEHRDEISLD